MIGKAIVCCAVMKIQWFECFGRENFCIFAVVRARGLNPNFRRHHFAYYTECCTSHEYIEDDVVRFSLKYLNFIAVVELSNLDFFCDCLPRVFFMPSDTLRPNHYVGASH